MQKGFMLLFERKKKKKKETAILFAWSPRTPLTPTTSGVNELTSRLAWRELKTVLLRQTGGALDGTDCVTSST